MKQRFCFPLKNKGFLFVKNSLIVSYIYCRVLEMNTVELQVRPIT